MAKIRRRVFTIMSACNPTLLVDDNVLLQNRSVKFCSRILSQSDPPLVLAPGSKIKDNSWVQLRALSSEREQKLREFCVFVQVSESDFMIVNAESEKFVLHAEKHGTNTVVRMKKLTFRLDWLSVNMRSEGERILTESLSKLRNSQLWCVSDGELRNKAHPDLVLVHLAERSHGIVFQESFHRVYLDSQSKFTSNLCHWSFRGHKMYNDLSTNPQPLEKRTEFRVPTSNLQGEIMQLLSEECTVEEARRTARQALRTEEPDRLRVAIRILQPYLDSSLSPEDFAAVNGDLAVYYLMSKSVEDVKASLMFCEGALCQSNILLLQYLKCQILLELRLWDSFIEFVQSTQRLQTSVYTQELEDAILLIEEHKSQWKVLESSTSLGQDGYFEKMQNLPCCCAIAAQMPFRRGTSVSAARKEPILSLYLRGISETTATTRGLCALRSSAAQSNTCQLRSMLPRSRRQISQAHPSRWAGMRG
mmetsp:Transcript_5772/g.21820  ORF Transcript_5772/g.21820 Transcript_5772/m.21820 type:complete len:476 (-) Transcript_5772:546-1973(-)